MFRYGGGFCGFDRFFGASPYGGMVMMGIGLILLIVLGYFLYKSTQSNGSRGGDESPLEMLQKRYVNGEISREEYEEKRRILKG